jgi:hypothetical protein
VICLVFRYFQNKVKSRKVLSIRSVNRMGEPYNACRILMGILLKNTITTAEIWAMKIRLSYD